MSLVRLMVVTVLIASVLILPVPTRAQEATPAASPIDGTLPDGATFEVITEATISELLTLSELVSISRHSFDPKDRLTAARGLPTPVIFLMESGSMPFHAHEDSAGPTTLLQTEHNGGTGTPVILTPGSPVPLQAGDLLATPASGGSYVGYTYGHDNQRDPATFIEVVIFPTGRP